MRTPLTEAEHARLRELLASGARGHLRQPEDERLTALGLVAVVACIAWARVEHVGPGGIEPYYERDGSVNQVSYPTIGQPDVLDPANCPERRGQMSKSKSKSKQTPEPWKEAAELRALLVEAKGWLHGALAEPAATRQRDLRLRIDDALAKAREDEER